MEETTKSDKGTAKKGEAGATARATKASEGSAGASESRRASGSPTSRTKTSLTWENVFEDSKRSEGIPLKDMTVQSQRQAEAIKKLQFCCVVFDFTGTDGAAALSGDYIKARDHKKQMLMELSDLMSNAKTWITDETTVEILAMIRANLFRALPPPVYEDFDPEEDDPNFDLAWPHLQFVYEFFHRFVMTADVKMMRRRVDKKFLLSVVELFNSEDPRERDYLKMILHRIYGRCMPFRSFIRKSLNNVLFPVIYLAARHNGVGEILEILGSIINGFAMPLKEEHVEFLKNVLIPLHKVTTLSQFHQQLAYCMTQFVQKDPSLAASAIGGLLKFWPATSCNKELLFINELEELLELTGTEQLKLIIEPLFSRIAKAICSRHFQVAERALFLWNNDIIATFTSDHRQVILPIIFPALQQNYEQHWNSTVSTLTLNIIRIFKEMDKKLFDKVNREYMASKELASKTASRESRWEELRKRSGEAAA